MLVQTKLYPEIENRFEEIFDVIISMLRYVQYMEQIQSSINKNKENTSDDENSADEISTLQRKNYLLSFLDIKEGLTTTLEDKKEQETQEEEEKREFGDNELEDDEDEEDEDENPNIFGMVKIFSLSSLEKSLLFKYSE